MTDKEQQALATALQKAIEETEKNIANGERSYAFAYGYLLGTIKQAILELEK